MSDIFDTLADTGSDYKSAKQALNDHFNPRKSIEFERFTFRQCHQEPSETVTQFHVRLQRLATHCEFAVKDGEVKSQIIQTCTSNKLRRYALRESSLTLAKLLKTARTYELADSNAAEIEQSTTVNRVEVKAKHTTQSPSTSVEHQPRNDSKRSYTSPTQHQQSPHSFSNFRRCRNCGGRYPTRRKRTVLRKVSLVIHAANLIILPSTA